VHMNRPGQTLDRIHRITVAQCLRPSGLEWLWGS
jgi:hypothetical protein